MVNLETKERRAKYTASSVRNICITIVICFALWFLADIYETLVSDKNAERESTQVTRAMENACKSALEQLGSK